MATVIGAMPAGDGAVTASAVADADGERAGLVALERLDQNDVAHGVDQGRRQDGGADQRHLRILHGHYLQGRLGMPRGAARRGLTVEPDGHQQECSGQDPGQLGGEVGQAQAVLKNGDGEEPQQRAGHAAATAEDRRPPEHDRRDRRQLVAGAGVGLGLAQVSHVDDRRQAGDQSREHVNQPDEPLDRQPGITRSFGREADRDQAAADRGPMEQDPERRGDDHEDRHLGGNSAQRIALAQKEEPLGKMGEVVHAAGQPFGQAAEHRERAERHDQGAGSVRA